MTPAQAILLLQTCSAYGRPNAFLGYLKSISISNVCKMQLEVTHIWSPYSVPNLCEWQHPTPATQPEPQEPSLIGPSSVPHSIQTCLYFLNPPRPAHFSP